MIIAIAEGKVVSCAGIKKKTRILLIWLETKITSDKVTLTLAKLYISINVTTADNILADAVFPSATFWLH